MRQDFTYIAVVLDRSGSMNCVKDATIEALNGFVESQKKGAGSANISLYQFDDVYEVVYENKPVADAPALTGETYQPRGSTALLDAIGRTIVATGAKLFAMAESDRPGTVIVVIQTDGQENASKEYTSAKVNELIAHQRDVYKWEFVFLGANQDAIASAAGFGIHATSALGYASNRRSSKAAFDAVGNKTNLLRAAKLSGQSDASYAFDDQDRQATQVTD